VNSGSGSKPFDSWHQNTCQWEAPVAYPDDENTYDWNEETKSWQEVTDE